MGERWGVRLSTHACGTEDSVTSTAAVGESYANACVVSFKPSMPLVKDHVIAMFAVRECWRESCGVALPIPSSLIYGLSLHKTGITSYHVGSTGRWRGSFCLQWGGCAPPNPPVFWRPHMLTVKRVCHRYGCHADHFVWTRLCETFLYNNRVIAMLAVREGKRAYNTIMFHMFAVREGRANHFVNWGCS